MGEAELTNLTVPLPEAITISGSPADMRMTPNEMRALRGATGRTLDALMGEGADDEDRAQALIWVHLYREGHRPTWAEAGDVAIQYQEAPEPDPTNESG